MENNDINTNLPLVTVVCMCYNHGKFLNEALHSVVNQSYPNIELIICDDASTDDSVAVIQSFVAKYPSTKTILNTQNTGNCTLFNKALKIAKGKYIIDLATDDILLENRIEKQVQFFEKQTPQTGIIYHHANLINEFGDKISDTLKQAVFQGNVLEHVIGQYFVCPPTMMMRKEMLLSINGYNEPLAYEDFDLWVRAAENWHFYFQNEILTSKRILSTSLSATFKHNDAIQLSTLKICEYIYSIANTVELQKALSKRVSFELRFALRNKQFNVLKAYKLLVFKMKYMHLVYKVVLFFF